MTEIRLHERLVKSVLRKAPTVDPYFVGKFSFSPYQACAHGCRYCDGRAERYWVEGVFDRDIVVRRNVADVLSTEVSRLREKGVVFIGSGISDAYQPVEADERLMPACARVLADHQLPATILTKSSLVARDIDVWGELNDRAGFTLMMSLVTADDAVRRVFEPGASPVAERLDTLRLFRSTGCAVGVAAMPLLPFLTDGPSDLDRLAAILAGTGVDFVLPGALTLRPGVQKSAFFETLAACRPDLVPAYTRLYEENRPSGRPRVEYLDAVQRLAEDAFASHGLPTVVPHRVYRGRIPIYDEVDVLLQHMAALYSRRGVPVRRLDASRRRYHDWLLARKAEMSRRRSLREGDLAGGLRALAASQEWPALLENEKLAAFLRLVILERQIFDEQALRLREPPRAATDGASR